ncbi:hypothetical protein [Paenibacillus harenae]|uniref:Uncharacterized protein n=1 Tax=Paenibacillus harenae TaxID=306543 RepID=A0ABT9U6T8_PAEHA|nr:hypothetical protein [Paenibacillus harenae]MDQ0115355.1 hypothetical protein [Paenibacillus harenae]
MSIAFLPLSAVIGPFGDALLVYALAWKNGVNPFPLVLVSIGIAFAAVGDYDLHACVQSRLLGKLFFYLADRDGIRLVLEACVEPFAWDRRLNGYRIRRLRARPSRWEASLVSSD